MPFRLTVPRVFVALLVLFHTTLGPSLHADDCKKRVLSWSFGLKTAFVVFTLGALTAHNYALRTENDALKSQLGHVRGILATQGDGDGAQVAAWQTKISKLAPAERIAELRNLYAIAREAPGGGWKTLRTLTTSLSPEERADVYFNAWQFETDSGKRYPLSSTFAETLDELTDKNQADRIQRDMLAIVARTPEADRMLRLEDVVVIQSERKKEKELTDANLAALLPYAEQVETYRGTHETTLQICYAEALAGAASPEANRRAVALIKKLWLMPDEGAGSPAMSHYAQSPLLVLAVNPVTPPEEFAIFLLFDRTSNNGVTFTPFVNAHNLGPGDFDKFVDAGNAEFLIQLVADEFDSFRLKPTMSRPSQLALARKAFATIAQQKGKNWSAFRGTLVNVTRAEILHSGKDSPEAALLRRYLAEATVQTLEVREGEGYSRVFYFGDVFHRVLGEELGVTFTGEQWDRLADRAFKNPAYMMEIFSANLSETRVSTQTLRPLLDRLIVKVEAEVGAPDDTDFERAHRVLALAAAARRDPQAVPQEKIVQWAKRLPPTASQYMPLEGILSGRYFEKE